MRPRAPWTKGEKEQGEGNASEKMEMKLLKKMQTRSLVLERVESQRRRGLSFPAHLKLDSHDSCLGPGLECAQHNPRSEEVWQQPLLLLPLAVEVACQRLQRKVLLETSRESVAEYFRPLLSLYALQMQDL